MKLAILCFAAVAAAGVQNVNLASATLRPVNRQVSRLQERGGVHVSASEGPGVAWIGIAFHRKDDQTYESVYLRPFNFQATDPTRHNHAVQYMQVPEFDWPVLREKFPEEFERPVAASVKPTDWVPLKVVVRGGRVQVFAGAVATPTMDVRTLGQLQRGAVGLWVGNNSDGDFANLRVTPLK
jgi:hypothetical protein